MLVAMGALLLAIPFVAVATPMALAQRAIMLRLFAPPSDRVG